jgi:NAD+ kinase
MARRFDTIALTGKRDDETVAESLRVLAAHLQKRHREILSEPSIADTLEPLGVRSPPLDEICAKADVMVAIGGDGTMLYATGLVAASGVPLLGINRGRLGFLMLEARITGVDTQASGFALNDVVLQKRDTGRMIDFETWIDGRYVNTHAGDGLVVATPTGSTAYALSGGGPIMHPTMDAIAMVPICPHTLSDRPLVVPAEADIDIRVIERADSHPEVTCDGRLLGSLAPEGCLEVRRAAHAAILIHPLDHDYFRILRSKLHWGRGSRNSGPRQTD